jgi:putative addiction module killer protein
VRLNRVMEGNFGDCAAVGEGVYELRFKLGPGYRIYFGEDGDQVILLGGGDKGTQERDIRVAKERWSDYNA